MSTTSVELLNRSYELLSQVLSLEPSVRSSFLERACAGEPTLRREIQGLLNAEETLMDRLEEPAWELLPGEGEGAATPSSIGPYEILRELGRGGCGVVYLAVRADGEYRRKVAVKVLKKDYSEELGGRFRSERQILAHLRHPNIAVLYEGGTTPDHRPYFVLEYVDGEPIDAYCATHELSLSQKLELFLKVCSAVQYAHQNLVIHRDLKPGNILVDAQGEPKLLDFGIAKLLEPLPVAGDTSTLTGLRPMTPQYASPEQLLGNGVTTATDVYGLGLVLYELLTGQRPFVLRGPLDFVGQQQVCEKDPPRPSAVVRHRDLEEAAGHGAPRRRRKTDRQLAGRLAGDLDTIVLTSLSKEPANRYPTVERLAEDVRRHLRGFPIRARRPTWRYRLGKLARRRIGTVAAAAILALVSGAFLVEHELQSRRIAQALSRAEGASRVLAEMVILSSKQSSEARQRIPREVLERGSEALAQLSGQTVLRAELMGALGRGYLSHRDFDRGAPLARDAYRLRREVFGDDDERVVESLLDLAFLEIENSRPRRAEALYRRALEIKRKHLGDSHAEVASLRNAVAASLYDQGRCREAEPLYRSALESKRRRVGDQHYDVAAIRNNLALALLNQGKVTEAEALLRQALEVSRASLRDTDGQVLAAKMNLAAALRARGSYEEAEAFEREVLETRRRLRSEHAVADAAERLAKTLLAKGEVGEARALAEEAVEIQQRLRGDGSFKTASAVTTLAEVLFALDRPAEAQDRLRPALTSFRSLGLDQHWRALEAQSLRGACLMAQGRGAEAESLLSTSLWRLRESVGEGALATRETRRRLAELYRSQGRLGDLARLGR